MIPIFDGHNDLLSKLMAEGHADPVAAFTKGRDGAIDAPRMKAGGMAGGFFALWVADETPFADTAEAMRNPPYDIPLPPPVAWERATLSVAGQIALLRALETAGHLTLCRSAADIRAAMEAGRPAALLHLEGAEAIDADLVMLDVLHAAGLRSLGPVWSRPTIFAHGVPFRYPASPDTGAGLTEAGRALVRRCNALGILIDLSHLNEAGFWEIADLSNAPLVATHSNVHAICRHSRNLTDGQLDAIAASDGIVGLNFAVSFLRPDGRKDPDTGLNEVLRHLDHLIDRLGDTRVALGSDFDGAVTPRTLSGADHYPRLIEAMSDHGYSDDRIARIAHRNWLRVIERTLGA